MTDQSPGGRDEATQNGNVTVWQGGEEEVFVARKIIDQNTLNNYKEPGLARWVVGVATEWGLIGAAIALCNAIHNPFLWVVAILFIGGRQHALGILAHDGTHYSVAKSKKLNDALANVLAAYPLMYTVEGYRTHHLEHHRWLETKRDPERAAIDLYPREWTFPMPRRRLLWLIARDCIGGSLKPASDLVSYIWQVPGRRWPYIARVAALHLLVIAIAAATGLIWSYLLLWVLPLFTVATMCFRVRTVAEHSGIGAPEDRYTLDKVNTLATTRTTVYGPLTWLMFGPHNMAYHVEHHLFPSVPVFRLRALHRELMRNPGYAARAHVTHGYRQLLLELTEAGKDRDVPAGSGAF